ncbi:PqqD family protein [Eubacterium barkeri]|uniref:Coenzyme PQQ synthesis protein D (PqqD) n=1 Tax=Eubacterium barkeri TaxID=1528 RepID=A0A1H3HJE6_EUBBA|nr:PqqD family protein [Eubacterium barkeri]SDY15597.1 Coenzyme PQQ synthesis protein D (PqqD) [Eubacterium barkeri]
MKIKPDFILTQLGGESIVVAAGEASTTFNGMIRLNPTAVCIWRCLEVGKSLEEVVDTVVDDFEVSKEQALLDVEGFIGELQEVTILE